MIKFTVLILGLVFSLGCSTSGRKGSARPPEADLISTHAATELARGAYTAGCVRTWVGRGEKGHFAECRRAADKYVDEEITQIVRGKVHKKSAPKP